MKFRKFLQDKLFAFIIFAATLSLVLLLFFAFKISPTLVFATLFILITSFIIILLIDFLRERKFYTNLLTHIENLDQAYLVLETLSRPNFYTGSLTCDALYAINKSMKENVNAAVRKSTDFQEYIEMWIHEVKTPLATLQLMNNHHHTKDTTRIQTELLRLESYLDQVLYFVRSENAEQDYLIKTTNLADIIKNVGIKNMNALLENHLDFIVKNVDFTVMTDAKWLEFILNQIVNNSIKYRRSASHPYIKISAQQKRDQIILEILDNGIGISPADLKRVFNKSFTGTNGRKITHSTGMGLYIAKNLCEKLGHQITITSMEHKSTTVTIKFSNHNYFDVVK